MKIIVVTALLLLAYAANASHSAEQDLKASAVLTDTIGVGQPAVPFTLTTPDGAELNSENSKGKVLVLDFWATWCSPCRKLTHEIDSVLSGYHAKKDFLMVGVDYRENKKEAAVAYWKDHGYTFPMASDNDVLGKAIKAGNPTIVVIDKLGIVRGRWDKYAPQVVVEVKQIVDKCLTGY